MPLPSAAVSLVVLDGRTGQPMAGGYRWMIEENAMKAVVPGEAAVPGESPSLSLHPSYMPVVAGGTDAEPPDAVVLEPGKRYFMSVLPDSDYQMGGAHFSAGDGSVTVSVLPQPVPTAQVTVFAFEDNNPLNNSPDLPQERGLAGFTVLLSEAGGTYGASGGQVLQDAFGNPVGTEYQKNPDGSFVFNPDGSPAIQSLGNGIVLTDANGVARIKYLPPAKYGVQLVPPAGQGWQQVTTIEGTKTIDAWVKAKEPPFLVEFGPPGHHVFMGFVRTFQDASVLTGGATITGKIVNKHTSRPPDFAMYNGDPAPRCWVGLNQLGGLGKGVYAKACNADSTFSIPNVPPGTYQLVVWDEYLDLIIGFYTVIVNAGQTEVSLLDVPVNAWFARLEGSVFFDGDGDGFRDSNETGIPEQAVNLRFRDGSIYQATATDPAGNYKFPEIFPFFNWLVAEVDFLRFKATGATVIVDAGGPVPPDQGWDLPSRNKLNPQPQFVVDETTGLATGTPEDNPNTQNNLSRSETGPVLLEGVQAFAGQTSIIDWGKAAYTIGHNGGVSGIVHYASTRAEDDPRYAAADNWEPKIPRVQVNLYRDCDRDGRIDAPDCIGVSSDGREPIAADTDNWPFGWSDGSTAKGPEDVDRNGNGTFDRGDAFDITWADSWDDGQPTGCQNDPAVGPFISNGQELGCFEGLRTYNQVRPAVFDGGYAFGAAAGKEELPVGMYVVEAAAPPGYEHVKEEDKNVDFGDEPEPSPLLLPPPCVGDTRVVPASLTLFPGVATVLGGQTRPLCDRKQIEVKHGQNAAVDFFMFTPVPVSAHIVGLVTDDINNGTNPASPNFGEKLSPGFVPISVHDWTGKEISRTYADQWGLYQTLVPSTFTANAPMPSGYAPNMLTTCINSPGPITDTRAGSPTFGQQITDPWFDRSHSHSCYTFQYMPGKTTYLDTPILPIAAFANQREFPVDCEFPSGTPVIYSVEGLNGNLTASYHGPRVPVPTGTAEANHPRLRIVSAGTVAVPNPAYNGTPGTETVQRNFGFGNTQGTGRVTLNGTALPIVSWSNGVIIARVPPGSSSGQLEVVRGNGAATNMGVTVTVSNAAPAAVVGPIPGPGVTHTSIQAAIDAAPAGGLILVKPGTYREMVVMHKKVRLQGWGAWSTVIDATKVLPSESLQAWRDKVGALLSANTFDLLPGQAPGFNPATNQPNLFAFEEGPGILVAGNAGEFNNSPRARIDGLMVTGASEGGGILVNGHAHYLEISNNKVISNGGIHVGGIRVGHPNLVNPATNGYTDAQNDFVNILDNHVALNGATVGSAGGIGMYTGADNYNMRRNYVCGNFSREGGGIAHLGRSDGGLIRRNTVLFNQAFQQGQTSNGGGVFVGGLPAVAAGQLSPGSGNVEISANLVQGNQAATGDGGGIRLQFVNGEDVRTAPNAPAGWHQVTLENNMVVDNVAGMAGGGISLQDVVRASIVNNTVANNDSTGTAIAAFAAGSPNQSAPQPAGIVSWAHSPALANAIRAPQFRSPFSNPELVNNIVWHNRSFYWQLDNTVVPATYGLVPDIGAGQPAVYNDLAVLGTANAADRLDPRFSILTNPAGYHPSNFSANPLFQSEYVNGDRALSITAPGTPSSMDTFAAFDEGGNFLNLQYGPLAPRGNYHLRNGSPAEQAAQAGAAPDIDFDIQQRPIPADTRPDIGADERN